MINFRRSMNNRVRFRPKKDPVPFISNQVNYAQISRCRRRVDVRRILEFLCSSATSWTKRGSVSSAGPRMLCASNIRVGDNTSCLLKLYLFWREKVANNVGKTRKIKKRIDGKWATIHYCQHHIMICKTTTYTGIFNARACSKVTSGRRTANEVPTKTITSASANHSSIFLNS